VPISKIIGTGFAFALLSIGLVLLALFVASENDPVRVLLWALAAICAFVVGYYFYLAALKVLRARGP